MPIERTRRIPVECTDVELAEFCNLVREEGQVIDAGLKDRVKQARWLVFLHDGRTLAGIAAIKQPSTGYRDRVFRSAGLSDLGHTYELELGYVVVAKTHQSQGYSRDLVRVALDGFGTTPLFATSRIDKERMHKTLRRFCFTPVGVDYASDEEGSHVRLFVRHPVGLPHAGDGRDGGGIS